LLNPRGGDGTIAGGHGGDWARGSKIVKMALVSWEEQPKPQGVAETIASLGAEFVEKDCASTREAVELAMVSGVRDCLDRVRPIYQAAGAADRLVVHHPEAGHRFPAAIRLMARDFLISALA
jgi:hypothetical protein